MNSRQFIVVLVTGITTFAPAKGDTKPMAGEVYVHCFVKPGSSKFGKTACNAVIAQLQESKTTKVSTLKSENLPENAPVGSSLLFIKITEKSQRSAAAILTLTMKTADGKAHSHTSPQINVSANDANLNDSAASNLAGALLTIYSEMASAK